VTLEKYMDRIADSNITETTQGAPDVVPMGRTLQWPSSHATQFKETDSSTTSAAPAVETGA